MGFINRNKQILVLAAMAVIFFFVYSYLSFFSSYIFNSPDETANFYFAKIFAEDGKMWQPEPLEFLSGNSIFPRSIKAIGGRLVPVGFIGLPIIYGIIAKIIGVWSIKFLTPFFAALAVFAFYGIIRRIFEERIAFFSSVLMFVLPPFWYYAERGMFHNVLFLCFAVLSFYFLISAGKKLFFWTLGGLFLSLALMTRMSETLWVVLILIALLIIFRKNIFWRGAFVAFAIFILVLIPFLSQNQILYGSPFATGYVNSREGQSAAIIAQNYLETKKDSFLVFPFGINLKNILWSGWNYFVMFFPWLSFPAIFGALLFLFRMTKNEKYYFGIFCFVAAWLFIYYGSWRFSDNLDPFAITIGTSYLRYWLPIFVMILPFFAKFFLWISEKLKIKLWKIGTPIAMAFFIFSFIAVFYTEGEGIFAIKRTLANYEIRAEEVFNLTENNSIIATDRNDKLFFPKRKIIYPLRSANTRQAVSSLLKFVSVYYYGLEISEEENFGDLKLELVKKWGNEGLYKFKISDL